MTLEDRYVKECLPIEDYEERTKVLRKIAEEMNIPFRSAVTKLSRAKLYVPKPRFQKLGSADLADSLLGRYFDSEKDLEEFYGEGALARLNSLAHKSKETLLTEIESILGLPSGCLYSLRSGTKLSIIAIYGAIDER